MSEKKFLIQGNLSLQSAYELEHFLMLKDRWHGEKDLKMRVNKHLKSSTIYFGAISQPWFKTTAKHFILYERVQGKSFGTLQKHTQCLQYFAQFLENKCVYSFSEITVEILSANLEKLHPFSPKTRNGRLGAVKAFFDLGTMNGWFDISTYWFNGRMPKVKPNTIDYMPQEVLRQLDEHLCLLPEQLQRMVILIRTLGLRACEILQMQFDCLRQRKNGKWEIHFINWKFNEKPDTIKCVPEIAEIIKEQQAYIRKHLGEEFKYLFCGNGIRGRVGGFKPSHKIMSLSSFSHYLNQLAQNCNICDQTGKQWRFKSHQFRRTIATTMTNAGVRQYIIQCYLRHLDPNMMQHYAHVLPETEKKEIEKLHKQKKIVDITGAEVSINHPELENDLGLQWLRSKMQPLALAMGFCARPQLLKPCPHANACMSCGHFRLDEDDLPDLKQHLERNRQLKVESERLGYIRQLKGIEEDEAQLIQLVQSLQGNNE